MSGYSRDPGFWEQSEYSSENFESESLTSESIEFAEKTLGYTLPRSYLDFLKTQNGGIPGRACFAVSTENDSDWVIEISGIFGVGATKNYSLCGPRGSRFWVEEWGHPDIGIYFAECPPGGHEMLCMDYRQCGKTGEPKIVHVDQENNYQVTTIAKNFEEFLQGLFCDKAESSINNENQTKQWCTEGKTFKLIRKSTMLANGGLHFQMRNETSGGGGVSWVPVPGHWEKAKLIPTETGVTIETGNGFFSVNSRTYGKLFEATLWLENPSDSDLEEIWEKCARKT